MGGGWEESQKMSGAKERGNKTGEKRVWGREIRRGERTSASSSEKEISLVVCIGRDRNITETSSSHPRYKVLIRFVDRAEEVENVESSNEEL